MLEEVEVTRGVVDVKNTGCHDGHVLSMFLDETISYTNCND